MSKNVNLNTETLSGVKASGGIPRLLFQPNPAADPILQLTGSGLDPLTDGISLGINFSFLDIATNELDLGPDGGPFVQLLPAAGGTASTYPLMFPSAQGAANQYMANDGSGNLSWASPVVAVTTVGTFAGSSQANGAAISGNTITFSPADGTNPGMVTTGNQTFAGAKTFSSSVIATLVNGPDGTSGTATTLRGGNGSTATGGSLTLQGGSSAGASTAGSISLLGGTATGTGTGGGLTVKAGLSVSSGAGATASFSGGQNNGTGNGGTTTISGGRANGTGGTGGNVIIEGGIGTGSGGIAGNVQIGYGNSSLQGMTWDKTGNTVTFPSVLSTSATDGFLSISQCAGAPTGTPTSHTGGTPLVYNTSANTLYAYNSGWQAVGGGSSFNSAPVIYTQTGSTTYTASSSGVQVNYDTVISDVGSLVSNPSTNWLYTCPATGLYTVNSSLYFNGSTVSSGFFQIDVYKNGSFYMNMSIKDAVGTTYNGINGEAVVAASSGDTLSIYFTNDSSGSKSTYTGANYTVVSIYRIA